MYHLHILLSSKPLDKEELTLDLQRAASQSHQEQHPESHTKLCCFQLMALTTGISTLMCASL